MTIWRPAIPFRIFACPIMWATNGGRSARGWRSRASAVSPGLVVSEGAGILPEYRLRSRTRRRSHIREVRLGEHRPPPEVTSSAFRAGLGARWAFLSDADRQSPDRLGLRDHRYETRSAPAGCLRAAPEHGDPLVLQRLLVLGPAQGPIGRRVAHPRPKQRPRQAQQRRSRIGYSYIHLAPHLQPSPLPHRPRRPTTHHRVNNLPGHYTWAKAALRLR